MAFFRASGCLVIYIYIYTLRDSRGYLYIPFILRVQGLGFRFLAQQSWVKKRFLAQVSGKHVFKLRAQALPQKLIMHGQD